MLTLAGKRVLVTGGAGFIGSHLVDRLILEEPAHVVVVDNLFLGKRSNLDASVGAFPSLVFHEADVSDYDVMSDIMGAERVDVVFDLAVVPLPTSLERPRFTCDTNLMAATVICELLRQGKYGTLVHFSSSEVYGSARYVPMDEEHALDPLTPYAASKAGADHIVSSYARTFQLDAVTVRPFNGFGPRQNIGAYAGIIPLVIRRVLAGDPVVIDGDGEQTRDFTFVREIAEATVRIYNNPATRLKAINVPSGEEVSVNDVVARLLAALGAQPPVVHGPARPGDVRRHCGSAALVESLTGFRPRSQLDEGLTETVAWYLGTVQEAGVTHPR